MKKQFLEAGRIINTHGVRGEVKIEPWCDSPQWLCARKKVYLDGAPVKVLSARAQGQFVLMRLEGVDDLDAAIGLKNKILSLNRDDVPLQEGTYFVEDLIGLKAVNDETGEEIGTVTDLLEMPAGRLYEIRGKEEHLIPERPEFVKKIDMDAGEIRFLMLEGL